MWLGKKKFLSILTWEEGRAEEPETHYLSILRGKGTKESAPYVEN